MMLVDCQERTSSTSEAFDYMYQQFTCQYCGLSMPWNYIEEHEKIICSKRPSQPPPRMATEDNFTSGRDPGLSQQTIQPPLEQFPYQSFSASSTATTRIPLPGDSLCTSSGTNKTENQHDYPKLAQVNPAQSRLTSDLISNNRATQMPNEEEDVDNNDFGLSIKSRYRQPESANIGQSNFCPDDESQSNVKIGRTADSNLCMKRIFEEFRVFNTGKRTDDLPKFDRIKCHPMASDLPEVDGACNPVTNIKIGAAGVIKSSSEQRRSAFFAPVDDSGYEQLRPSCVYCGLKFTSGSRMTSAVRIIKHEEMCMDNPTNICRMCGQKFGGSHLELTVKDIKNRLNRHIQICERNPYSRLVCPFCQEMFRSSLSRSSHDRLKEHLMVYCNVATKLKSHCKHCGEFMDYGVLETPATKLHAKYCRAHNGQHSHQQSGHGRGEIDRSRLTVEQEANEIIEHLNIILQRASSRENLRTILRQLQLKWHPDRHQLAPNSLHRTTAENAEGAAYSKELANLVFLYVQRQWESAFRSY